MRNSLIGKLTILNNVIKNRGTFTAKNIVAVNTKPCNPFSSMILSFLEALKNDVSCLSLYFIQALITSIYALRFNTLLEFEEMIYDY